MTDEVTTEQAPPKKAPKKGLLIGAIAGGALAGIGAGAFAFAPALSPTTATAAEAEPAAEGSTAGAADSAAVVTAPTVLTNLVVNPAGSRGTRFLLVSVGFEFVPALPDEEFARRETEIRDRVLAILSTKTIDELVDYTHRDAFRAEIKSIVDSTLGSPRVRRVFFPQFVIQ